MTSRVFPISASASVVSSTPASNLATATTSSGARGTGPTLTRARVSVPVSPCWPTSVAPMLAILNRPACVHLRGPSLESSVQCTRVRDRTWSERPRDDRRVRIRPGQRSHATRPPPKGAWPALHRSVEPAEGPTPRAPCAGQPRFRACAQHGDGCSAGERHDFPYSELKRRGTPTRFRAGGQSVRLVDGPREHH